MQDPSTTTRAAARADAVADKVAPLAMYAVVEFMLEHKLPAPLSIRGYSRCPSTTKAINIGLTDLEAWSDATGAEYIGTETSVADTGRRYCVVTERGRVPSAIGDVAVLLHVAQWVEWPDEDVDTKPVLSLVGGGAA